MMEGIYKELNKYPYYDDVVEKEVELLDAKTLILMDISRSLAVIADKLDKED